MDSQAAAEETLRDLSIRGDIIKTMHRAMSGRGASLTCRASRFMADRPPIRFSGGLPSVACMTS